MYQYLNWWIAIVLEIDIMFETVGAGYLNLWWDWESMLMKMFTLSLSFQFGSNFESKTLSNKKLSIPE